MATLTTPKQAYTQLPPREGVATAHLPGWALGLFGAALLYAFLLALDIVTRSVGLLAGPWLEQLARIAGSPLAGLFIGLLTTATLQSSTAVTAFLVAFVSAGALTLDQAVPMVLGANIGTTFTALLVSLSNLTSKKEFRKGLTAALQHNYFNVITCLLAFPLEIQFHLLSRTSQAVAQALGGALGTSGKGLGSFVTWMVAPLTARLVHTPGTAILWAVAGLLLLFGCVLLFRTVLRYLWIGKGPSQLSEGVFGHRWRALGLGAGLTAFIHSSTVTTSLCVPLAASGVVPPRRLLPFIIGANVGTTITAVIAALGRSEAALALAFSHLLFNVAGGALVMGIPYAERWLGMAARISARLFARQRSLVFVFLVLFFFVLPIGVILVSAG